MLQTRISKFINIQYSAHDTLADVESLQQLVLHTNTNVDILSKNSELTTSLVDMYKYNKDCDDD